MKLQVSASSITVCCPCGEEVEFDGIHDGWQHIDYCEMCGQRISVHIDQPTVQIEPGEGS